jgi:hypothetical protein
MDSKSTNVLKELIQVNNLVYEELGQVSLVDRRQYKKFYARKTTYLPSEEVVIDCQGEDWVYGPTSHLKMTITFTNNAGADRTCTTNGDALTAFDEITFSNGKELCRTQRSGALSKIIRDFEMTSGDSTIVGTTGVETRQNITLHNFKTATIADGATESHTVMIPMSRVCPIFNNRANLVPAKLWAGAELRMKVQTANKFLFAETVGPVNPAAGCTFTISNVEIFADTFQLSGSARIYMDSVGSRANGMVFSYAPWLHREHAIAGTGGEFDIAENKGQVLRSVAIIRDSDKYAQTHGSFNAAYEAAQKYRYRLGSHYMPDQPADLYEAYVLAGHSFDAWRDGKGGQGNTDFKEFQDTRGIMACQLETMALSDLPSGVDLSHGSRRLRLEVNDITASNTNRLNAWTQYVAFAKVYSDGRIEVMS